MPQLGSFQLGGGVDYVSGLGIEDVGSPLTVGETPVVPGPCKADIYFLCDNTGSMGTTITPIKAAVNTLITDIEALATKDGSTFDVAFGVGNYNDFPFPPRHVRYGDNYSPSAGYSLTLTAGSAGTLPLGPGPSSLPGPNWVSPVAATISSPITYVTLPPSTLPTGPNAYRMVLRLHGVTSGGGGNITIDIKGSVTGVFTTDTFSPGGGSTPWVRETTADTTFFTQHPGEQISVTITNNMGSTLNVLWSTSFLVAQRPPSGVNNRPAFALSPQVDIIQGNDALVARAVNDWIDDSGSDYSESWLYALDRLCHGAVNWRVDSTRYVVLIGDSPSHTDICPALGTNLTYSVDKNNVLTAMQANGLILLGVSVYGGAGNGLDDSDSTSHSYDPICGHTDTPAGQATYIANGTRGRILPVNRLAGSFSTDIVNAVLDIIEAGTKACRIPGRRFSFVHTAA